MIKTVLVVDDHPEVAKALVFLARSLGYNARAVYSGRQALDDVRTNFPDVVLLDLQMPDISGWDVLAALRGQREFERLPVIICSAASAAVSRQQAIEAGAQDYMDKDKAFEELEDVLNRQAAA